MKNNFKKILSFALTFVLVFAVSLTALAADITREQAISIALEDAGYNAENTLYSRAELDYDDGIKYYEVEFAVALGENLVGEYEYEVRASDGAILSKDSETEYRKTASLEGASQAVAVEVHQQAVTLERAKEIAVGEFGFNVSEIQFLKAKEEYDDGRAVYEIEFRNGFEAKYSCEIDASTGIVTDKEKEVIRSFEDKIELLFEIIIAWLVMR